MDTLEASDKAIHDASGAAWLCATVTAVAAILSAWGVEAIARMGIDLSALFDAGIFALIAWGLRRRSRVAAVAGLSLYILGRIVTWSESGAKNPGISVILTLAFLGGVRGAFAWHRLRASPVGAATPPQ